MSDVAPTNVADDKLASDVKFGPSTILVGSLDQGTTSTRFILFTSTGDPVHSHQIEHEQITPDSGSGRLEHNPTEILENAKICIDECIATANQKYGIDVSQVKAIGITNQRETTVVWDRNTGNPLYNAIVWSDARTHSTCNNLRQQIKDETVREITGLPISTYFSGVKLRWMLDNVPEVREAVDAGTAYFGTIDTWLLWNLSEEKIHATDVTNAGRTMMMNIHTLQWDQRMLDFLGVNPAILPEIKSCSEEFGHIKGTALDGKLIAGLIGDQQSALVGQGCFEFGKGKNTYGTGCFLIVNTGKEPKFSTHKLLTTPAYKIGPDADCVYSLEGSVANAGSTVQWLRDKLGMISGASQMEPLAREVENTGGLYFVPAFNGLFAPWWDETARGTIVGMTAATNKSHFLRATLEAIAFMVNDVLTAAEKDMGAPLAELRVDGGASVNNLLLELQANITGSTVKRPKVIETTALGAAFCAGHAVGLFASEEEFQGHWELDREFLPTNTLEDRKASLDRWKEAVQKSQGWVKDSPTPTEGLWKPDVVAAVAISSCVTAIFTTVICKFMQGRK